MLHGLKRVRQFVFYVLKQKGSNAVQRRSRTGQRMRVRERATQSIQISHKPTPQREQTPLPSLHLHHSCSPPRHHTAPTVLSTTRRSAVTLSRPQNVAVQTPKEVRISLLTTQPFPKVLWILCGEGGLDGLPMLEAITARHQISIAEQSGYEVRVVDIINAYQWLTPETTEMIRRAKHKTQYYIPVAELLRIALLMEHGGVSAQLDSIVFA